MKRRLLLLLLISITFLSSFAQDLFLEDGNSSLAKGDFDAAEKVFRDGIASDPTNLVFQCQLGLVLIQKGKYTEAELVLDKVLATDSLNIAANWYKGVGNYKNGKARKAIENFETVLPRLDEHSGQYFSAFWFIGKSYSNLLRTEGLTYKETSRMLDCYEEYLRLQPNAKDSDEIRRYVDRKKKRRPSENVEKWIDL